jgi:hypothetical protein
MEVARSDLERFDRVLGSAEAISDAVEGSGRVARTAFSVPVIKMAGLATGHDTGGPSAARPRVASRCSTSVEPADGGNEHEAMTWFVTGVAAGATGRELRREEGEAHRGPAGTPANVAKGAADRVKQSGTHLVDAIREGRAAMHDREDELKARRDGRVGPRRTRRPRRPDPGRRSPGRARSGHRAQAAAPVTDAASTSAMTAHDGRDRRRAASGARARAGSHRRVVPSPCTAGRVEHGGDDRSRLLPDHDRRGAGVRAGGEPPRGAVRAARGRAPGWPAAPCRSTARS